MEETPFFSESQLAISVRLAVRRNYQHLIISKVLFLLTLLEISCMLFMGLYLNNEFAGRKNRASCPNPFKHKVVYRQYLDVLHSHV
jgi:hypothetical protein